MRRTITTLLIAALSLSALRADAQERWTAADGPNAALERGYAEIHPAVEAIYEVAGSEPIAEVSYQPIEPAAEAPPPLAIEAPPIAEVPPATENPPVPAPAGGHYYEPYAGPNCPCTFNTYWDLTGGRSPTEWAGWLAYGPECHAISAKLEWLMWFSRGRDIPPLASRFTDIQAGQVIGADEIFGQKEGDEIGQNVRNGARLSLGGLLPDQATWAEGRFWGLEDSSERFFVDSSNEPRLLRPYLNVTTGQPGGVLLSNPGEFVGGTLDALAKNDLFGFDAWLRRTWWDDGRFRLDLLAGYQFTRLDDSLRIVGATTQVASATRFEGRDLFATQNEFHGGTLGFLAETRRKCWSVEILGKLGLGNVRERVTIDGETVVTDFPGGTVTVFDGGVLALPSNMGVYTRDRFAIVPELNVNCIVNLSPNWRIMAGYSLIYWSDAVVAGNQIDLQVNPTQIPGVGGPPAGVARPLFNFVDEEYWVQGINMGAEYRW